MKQFKHILAATDLSAESLSAVSYAAHLAQGQGASLTILHVPHSISLVYSEFVPPVNMADIDRAIDDSSREQLERWAKKNLRSMPKYKILMRKGVADDVICKVAEEIGASVIVVATHGRRGIARLALGSVAESVIRQAPCPVLVVRPPKPKKRTTRTSQAATGKSSKRKTPPRKSA